MWKPDSNCPIWTRHSLLYDVSLCKQAACGLGVLYVKAENACQGMTSTLPAQKQVSIHHHHA